MHMQAMPGDHTLSVSVPNMCSVRRTSYVARITARQSARNRARMMFDRSFAPTFSSVCVRSFVDHRIIVVQFSCV